VVQILAAEVSRRTVAEDRTCPQKSDPRNDLRGDMTGITPHSTPHPQPNLDGGHRQDRRTDTDQNMRAQSRRIPMPLPLQTDQPAEQHRQQ